MKNKNILFHIGGNQYGSDYKDQHTFRIWQELSKSFDEYHVFARSRNMRFESFNNGNIYLHLIPSSGSRMAGFFFSSWVLPIYILKYKPNFLLAQCPVMGGLATSFSSLLFKVPLLVELHGTHYFKPARKGLLGIIEHKAYKLLSKPTFNQANNIRLLSKHMAKEFTDIYGSMYANKAVVIPVRVDFDQFLPKSDYKIDWTIKLINVGRLCDNKNQLGLLQDIRSIKQNIEITFVGSGEKQQEIECYVKGLPPNISVILAGQVSHEELNLLLNNSDIYVHYAKSEGTPRAIIEAMATGLPVIVSDAGFMNNLLIHKFNCLLVVEDEKSRVVDYIEELSSSESERVRLGKQGLKTVYENFEWNTIFDLYRDTLLNMKKL